MALKVDICVTVDGEDYESLSSALDLARRYIAQKKRPDMGVDEFTQKEVAQIETIMNGIWCN